MDEPLRTEVKDGVITAFLSVVLPRRATVQVCIDTVVDENGDVTVIRAWKRHD